MNATAEPNPHAMTKDDLAGYLGVTKRTINRWQRWLPHVKIGKIVRYDLDQVKAAMQKRYGRNQPN